MLAPIYNEAADKIKQEFPEDGKVVMGAVDCDREGAVAARYAVSKYPTLKIFRHGNLVRREYRGQRSTEALVGFLKEQLHNPVQLIEHNDDLDNLDVKKRHIIGYFDNEESSDYDVFKKVAIMHREDCLFHAAIGLAAEQGRPPVNQILFRPQGTGATDIIYTGPLSNQNLLSQWSTDKCVPLVREITFENAEELTEEGLPFVILFHDPSDTETPDKYRQAVTKELFTEKNTVNFLTADGRKFAHPLNHMGKSANDLPLIIIDSFRHMYLWPHDPRVAIERPGLLKVFINDLNSGKLHREFHHGPDPVQSQTEDGGEAPSHVTKDGGKAQTSPPESVFRKLAPSNTRYTLLRDEL